LSMRFGGYSLIDLSMMVKLFLILCEKNNYFLLSNHYFNNSFVCFDR
jgi:hypothetical protein